MDIIRVEQQIKEAITAMLIGKDMDIIECRVLPGGGKYIIRCVIDHPHGGVTIDECAVLNRQVVNFLEEQGLLDNAFIVEVNSPGMDRKLFTYKDFLRVQGRSVGLWLSAPLNGDVSRQQEDTEHTYVEGVVTSVTEKGITINIKDNIFDINFSIIKVGREKIKI